MCGRYDPAIPDTKMEQRQQVINILSSQKIWDLKRQIEPSWNCYNRVSAWNGSILRNIFLNLHMNLICVRIKIEHHRLLRETILAVNFGSDLIEVLINGLFDVDSVTINPVDMGLDILKGNHPLFDLPVGPNSLDTIGCSFLNDLINRKLRSTLSPFISFESVLNRCNSCNSLEQPFKKQNHLLVLMDVDTSVVI